MATIVALFMFCSSIALLGVITLGAFPFWRVTISNVVTFVFGGLIGMVLLLNVVKVAVPYVLELARIRGELPYGTMLGWATLILGAEFGGITGVYLKTVLARRWNSSHRSQKSR